MLKASPTQGSYFIARKLLDRCRARPEGTGANAQNTWPSPRWSPRSFPAPSRPGCFPCPAAAAPRFHTDSPGRVARVGMQMTWQEWLHRWRPTTREHCALTSSKTSTLTAHHGSTQSSGLREKVTHSDESGDRCAPPEEGRLWSPSTPSTRVGDCPDRELVVGRNQSCSFLSFNLGTLIQGGINGCSIKCEKWMFPENTFNARREEKTAFSTRHSRYTVLEILENYRVLWRVLTTQRS